MIYPKIYRDHGGWVFKVMLTGFGVKYVRTTIDFKEGLLSLTKYFFKLIFKTNKRRTPIL